MAPLGDPPQGSPAAADPSSSTPVINIACKEIWTTVCTKVKDLLLYLPRLGITTTYTMQGYARLKSTTPPLPRAEVAPFARSMALSCSS